MGLTDSNPRAFAPGPILTWLPKNLHDLVFRDAVRVDVWQPRRRINVEANFHVANATTVSRTRCAARGEISSTSEV